MHFKNPLQGCCPGNFSFSPDGNLCAPKQDVRSGFAFTSKAFTAARWASPSRFFLVLMLKTCCRLWCRGSSALSSKSTSVEKRGTWTTGQSSIWRPKAFIVAFEARVTSSPPVIVRVTARGNKRLLAIEDEVRNPTQSSCKFLLSFNTH